jgi:acetyltransferase-like isoleucine patch superfamily enzyme
MKKIKSEFSGNSTLQYNFGSVSENIHVGENVFIEAETVEIGVNVRIGDNVYLKAKHIKVGNNSKIDNNVGFNQDMDNVSIGDHTEISEGVKIRVKGFSVGDYGRIHSEVVLYGQKECTIGHNCWIGQWCILNTKEKLEIGNNFRVGVQSQIWTHVASGELIEGCKMYNVESTIIEDDVWLVGHTIISPGIRIRKKTTVLPGAILSKDTIEGHCYAGIPAIDITEKYNPYAPITLDEKYEMMKGFINTFTTKRPEYLDKVFLLNSPDENECNIPEEGALIIYKDANDNFVNNKNSIFDIKTKKYNKQCSPIEIAFILDNLGHKARFVPNDCNL